MGHSPNKLIMKVFVEQGSAKDLVGFPISSLLFLLIIYIIFFLSNYYGFTGLQPSATVTATIHLVYKMEMALANQNQRIAILAERKSNEF